jgi:hypothetical protein
MFLNLAAQERVPRAIIALMMEAASTSKTLVNFYQTTQRNIPEDSHLQTRCCEDLKSHLLGCDVLILVLDSHFLTVHLSMKRQLGKAQASIEREEVRVDRHR